MTQRLDKQLTMAASMAQSSSEAETYVSTYLKCVEHIPNKVQRQISTIKELDVSIKSHFQHITCYLGELDSLLGQSDVVRLERSHKLVLVENALSDALEDFEEKLQALTKVQLFIKKNLKQLNDDHENLESMPQDQENTDPNKVGLSLGQNTAGHALEDFKEKLQALTKVQLFIKKNLKQLNDDHENLESRPQDQENTEPNKVSLGQNTAGPSTSSTGVPGKKKRKRQRRIGQQQSQQRKKRPLPEDIGSDDSMHCLCDGVSFGNMIKCDNDKCIIQWFHFQCVGLSGTCEKEGKWYCPECRGDELNVMKPNVECLRELARELNKQNEEM